VILDPKPTAGWSGSPTSKTKRPSRKPFRTKYSLQVKTNVKDRNLNKFYKLRLIHDLLGAIEVLSGHTGFGGLDELSVNTSNNL
jgi:hypothetical protein